MTSEAVTSESSDDGDRAGSSADATTSPTNRCIGAPMAHLVMRTVLSEILRRMPDLAVAPDDGPTYSNSGVARNVDTLPLVLTPAAREGAG